MKKVYVALDFSTREALFGFLDQFDEPIGVKLGMEVVYGLGFEVIQEVASRGHEIFLDLKLHDIPNTVAKATANLAKYPIRFMTIHAAGGIEMMKAAKSAAGSVKVLAVTALTSLSSEQLKDELLIEAGVEKTVLQYAQNAKAAGLDGIICSVHEAKRVHEVCGADFITMTPGIRLAGDGVQDQKRVADPQAAKEQGCDFIVVGRAITQSANPKLTYQKIESILE